MGSSGSAELSVASSAAQSCTPMDPHGVQELRSLSSRCNGVAADEIAPAG
jgi:hypothetical protein